MMRPSQSLRSLESIITATLQQTNKTKKYSTVATMSPLSHEEEEAVMNEEEEEEEEERRGRKRKNKMKMGEDSGLTDGQRRQLRRDQRDLAKKLQEGPEGDEDEDFVEKARKTNNKLFENVRFTREAVLDAENVDTIAAKFVSQAEGMIRYVSKLLNYAEPIVFVFIFF